MSAFAIKDETNLISLLGKKKYRAFKSIHNPLKVIQMDDSSRVKPSKSV